MRAPIEDPFHYNHGLEYCVQVMRHGDTKWSEAMEWVTKETAIANCRKLVEEGFMQKVRCVRVSRYPPWPICSVHYYREIER